MLAVSGSVSLSVSLSVCPPAQVMDGGWQEKGARRGVCHRAFTASSRSRELCSKGGGWLPTRSGIICFFCLHRPQNEMV